MTTEPGENAPATERRQTLPPYFGGKGSEMYSYGPLYQVIPARQYVIQPSRSQTTCPLCGRPVDVRERHAVVQEQVDGRVVAGSFAHVGCCEPLETIGRETEEATDDR